MILETDLELIQKTLAGNRSAAARLTSRYRDAVTRIAYAALNNRDDALDIAQESLMYALQHLTDVRDPTRLSAWLRHVTLSLCVDYRRRRGTRRLGEPITALNERIEESRFEEGLAVRQALAHLSEAHRTTVLLHYVGGWSLEEVSGLLAIPVNTVRSRLMTAKRLLRADLPADLPDTLPQPLRPAIADKPRPTQSRKKPMPETKFALTQAQTQLIDRAFPKSQILTVQNDLEPWQPFGPRIRLALADGSEKTVDFRGDLTPGRATLVSVLAGLNIPGPRILHGPVQEGDRYLTLCEQTRGENLTSWAMGGTPHRIRLATERAIEGIERLQGATEGLRADPVGATLPTRTLTDEIAILTDDAKWNADWWLAEEGKERKAWLNDAWFASALAKVQAAIADIAVPLVYTDYTFFFPQGYRIAPGSAPTEEPLGWPGDPHYQENPLVEFAYLFGHFGDPLLGLAMVWVYDCYPFVHTGFVEQVLWRRNITRREFAPRLALKALQMVARDLPVARPEEGRYWDGLRGWVEQGLAWM